MKKYPNTVPTGTFEAYNPEVSQLDGSADMKTVWISKDMRKVIKNSVVAAAMSEAIDTIVLSE